MKCFPASAVADTAYFFSFALMEKKQKIKAVYHNPKNHFGIPFRNPISAESRILTYTIYFLYI